MVSRRGNNEGTVEKLPSGSWRARVSVDGRRLSATRRTRNEALGWIREVTGQVEAGLTYDASTTSLGSFLEKWLANKATELEPATVEQYNRTARLYLIPNLGAVKMKDMQPARIQAVYDRLLEDGTGARTIEVCHAVLHGCLEQAYKLGLPPRNPSGVVIVPKVQAREMEVWSESEVFEYLYAITGHRNEQLYRLALATGMRRGELLGLQWGDLDWNGSILRIQRQVYNFAGGWLFKTPKTDRGIRNIPIGKNLVEHLREQAKIVQALRVVAGSSWVEYDLIFPRGDGQPQTGNQVSKEFDRLIEIYGLRKIRFYDMRHTAASIMLKHGRPPVEVAYILGDSLGVLLQTYAHYIPMQNTATADLMDEIVQTYLVGHELDTPRDT